MPQCPPSITIKTKIKGIIYQNYSEDDILVKESVIWVQFLESSQI
jgi:hypothetical protein